MSINPSKRKEVQVVLMYNQNMKKFFLKVWHWHGVIGKFCTMFVVAAFVAGVLGLAFGLTKCQKTDEVYYTNIFLGEEFSLHDDNYIGIAKSAFSADSIDIIDKNNETKHLDGHFICIDFCIFQKEESKLKVHKIDANDFKLKDHTGVHVPASDIASMMGWDMIDYRWDQAKNGFVVSSADFETRNAIKDYSYINKEIKAGQSLDFTVYFEMKSEYNVENEIMVLEADFFVSWNASSKRMGEDVILLPRPENLPKDPQ